MSGRWTVDEISYLFEVWDSDLSLQDIADQLRSVAGRSVGPSMICVAGKTYGLPTRRWNRGARWIEAHANDAHTEECLIWPFNRHPTGYAANVTWNGKPDVKACRAMCEVAHGAAPTPSHDAAHNCGRGHMGCIHPTHLRWATRVENHADRIAHGTIDRGERSPLAKLTQNQVLEIRAIGSSVSAGILAEKFGVSRGHICGIIAGRSWKFIT